MWGTAASSIGLVTLSVGILDFIPKEDTTAALLGFFVFIPAVGLIGAVLLGTLLSIRLSGHPALGALSVLSLAAIVALFAGYGRSSSGTIAALAYGLVATALSVLWFFTRRSRTV
jgi:hypothetical protein